MKKKIILFGLFVITFFCSVYVFILCNKAFTCYVDLHHARMLKEYKIIFQYKNSEYVTSIDVKREQIQYFNLYPKIQLDFKQPAPFATMCKCTLVDSNGERTEKKVQLSDRCAFTLGNTVTEGINYITLKLDSQRIQLPNRFEGRMIFNESSNVALPISYLLRACLMLIILIILGLTTSRYTKVRSIKKV